MFQRLFQAKPLMSTYWSKSEMIYINDVIKDVKFKRMEFTMDQKNKGRYIF